MIERLRNWLALSEEPNVILAQYRALRRQIPLLYALLLLNTCAVTYTHWRFAPVWLTLGSNGLLAVVSCWRMLLWMVSRNEGAISPEQARRKLRTTIVVAGVLGSAFVSWSLMLNPYGGAIERGHVALFIGVTVIGCIFCLVHLPQAAMLVTAVVTGPYLLYYAARGDPVFIAMAVNIALVTGVMIQVLLNSFEGFTSLIRSKTVLAAKQQEAERLGQENALLAHTDVLTGLPNHRHFFAELERLLQRCKLDGGRLAVGMIDLDRFKPVNDTYGHFVGDRLLMEVGNRLAGLAGDGLQLARLGGDEFGLLLTRDIDDARAIGQSICNALSEPFFIDDHRITLGCSAGVSTYPDVGTTVHELFDRSDYALYHVKLAREGGCALFSLEHETLIRSERAIEAALQTADLNAELHVRFQPIHNTQTRAVVSVEALCRWTSPIIGSVSPDRFITMAERLGYIHDITTLLFRKALTDFAKMPDTIGLSFNLSANDIGSHQTVPLLIRMIEEAGVDPKRITFELTETALMRDFDAAVQGIRSLRALGIRVALDDFGTGYSSLGYLRRLPLDKVKVDRSFATALDEASGRTIIAAILGLCQTLELDCIMEGVETEAQLQVLRELGCRVAQGYLFAEPMTIGDFLGWIRGHEADAGEMPSIARRVA